MKKLLWLMMIFGTFLWAGAWNNNMETARTFAKNRGQVLMVFVESEYCKWCRKMKIETFSDPRAMEVFDRITRLKVNSSDTRLLGQLPRIQGVPTLFFMDPADKQIFVKVSGYRDVGEFLKVVSMAQNYYNQKYKKR